MENEECFEEVEDGEGNWKDCPLCGAEIMQVRKAFFKCINCGQEIIAVAEDMRR